MTTYWFIAYSFQNGSGYTIAKIEAPFFKWAEIEKLLKGNDSTITGHVVISNFIQMTKEQVDIFNAN